MDWASNDFLFLAVQVVEAVNALHSEFRAVDNLVARNTTRVLKAFQTARVGSHVIMHMNIDSLLGTVLLRYVCFQSNSSWFLRFQLSWLMKAPNFDEDWKRLCLIHWADVISFMTFWVTILSKLGMLLPPWYFFLNSIFRILSLWWHV